MTMLLTDMCFLNEDIYHFVNVSQGKITIPGVHDDEELLATDVSNFIPVMSQTIPTRINNKA